MVWSSPMRRPELTRRNALIALAIVAAIAFRVAVVLTYHKPAGDGMQYFQLAQELRRANRFAFAPTAPASYARLPGYPLFLAYVALPGPPRPLEWHLRAATLWNVAFDLVTALLVVAIARRLGLPRPRALGVFVIFWPTLWL